MLHDDEMVGGVPAALLPLLASHVPGRLRLRGAALRSAKMLARVREAVLQCDGVLECRINARVGSVLLRYEPQRLPQQALLARLATTLPAAAQQATPDAAAQVQRARRRRVQAARRRVNTAVQYGMALSLGTSLLAAARGATGAHVAAGNVFLALLALHVIRGAARCSDRCWGNRRRTGEA